MRSVPKNRKKLYCYADETWRKGKEKLFLVSVVIIDQDTKEGLERKLEEIELVTGKMKTKWTRTKHDIRLAFLQEVAKIKTLQSSIFYSVYEESFSYTHLTSLSVAKAILGKDQDEYSATIIIDGLTKTDTEKVRKDLKQLKIKYDNIRGMKDEQSVFLRLADCFAGFIRDHIEGSGYTHELFSRMQKKGIVKKV